MLRDGSRERKRSPVLSRERTEASNTSLSYYMRQVENVKQSIANLSKAYRCGSPMLRKNLNSNSKKFDSGAKTQPLMQKEKSSGLFTQLERSDKQNADGDIKEAGKSPILPIGNDSQSLIVDTGHRILENSTGNSANFRPQDTSGSNIVNTQHFKQNFDKYRSDYKIENQDTDKSLHLENQPLKHPIEFVQNQSPTTDDKEFYKNSLMNSLYTPKTQNHPIGFVDTQNKSPSTIKNGLKETPNNLKIDLLSKQHIEISTPTKLLSQLIQSKKQKANNLSDDRNYDANIEKQNLDRNQSNSKPTDQTLNDMSLMEQGSEYKSVNANIEHLLPNKAEEPFTLRGPETDTFEKEAISNGKRIDQIQVSPTNHLFFQKKKASGHTSNINQPISSENSQSNNKFGIASEDFSHSCRNTGGYTFANEMNTAEFPYLGKPVCEDIDNQNNHHLQNIPEILNKRSPENIKPNESERDLIQKPVNKTSTDALVNNHPISKSPETLNTNKQSSQFIKDGQMIISPENADKISNEISTQTENYLSGEKKNSMTEQAIQKEKRPFPDVYSVPATPAKTQFVKLISDFNTYYHKASQLVKPRLQLVDNVLRFFNASTPEVERKQSTIIGSVQDQPKNASKLSNEEKYRNLIISNLQNKVDMLNEQVIVAEMERNNYLFSHKKAFEEINTLRNQIELLRQDLAEHKYTIGELVDLVVASNDQTLLDDMNGILKKSSYN
jgi:hypothetical protein